MKTIKKNFGRKLKRKLNEKYGIFNILKVEIQLDSFADPHHIDTDPNPAFHFNADPDPDPTTHFFPDLYPPMLQNDPLKLPPFNFDANPDPDFHVDADADRKMMRIRICN
jgi:hypothetical protein